MELSVWVNWARLIESEPRTSESGYFKGTPPLPLSDKVRELVFVKMEGIDKVGCLPLGGNVGESRFKLSTAKVLPNLEGLTKIG